MTHYADTSALVKLVVPEAESAALRDWLSQRPRALATSELARTELGRAIGRADVDAGAALRARDLLRRLTLLSLTPELLHAAGSLQPQNLRSLDAIHLVSAQALGDDLEGVVTYDERMADAATLLGLPVLTP